MSKKSIGFEIKTINDLIKKRIMCDKENDCHISHTQIKIIQYMYIHKEEVIYQRDLEKKFDLKRSTISGIIDTMEKNNLVKRIDSKEDLRLKKLVLTDMALNKINVLVDKIVKFDKSLEKNISKKDLDTFYKVTEQIKNNIINEEA